jgi:cyclopropane-fatty-acyl-phospholipid synthase
MHGTLWRLVLSNALITTFTDKGPAMLEQQIIRHLHALSARRPLPARVALWDGTQVPLGPDARVGIRLNSPGAARYLLHPTLDALGEGYVEGHLDVDGRIDDVMTLAESLARADAGLANSRPVAASVALLGRALRRPRHSRQSDRQAIAYHYDVSNDFYRCWLDERMVYSCAYFESESVDLEAAQLAKLEHICRKLRLVPGHTLLDIGCGWGALAIHAARHHGAQVVGITLSAEQHALARERVAQAGLSSQVEIRLQDYRDLTGEAVFDRIASVGMFEHVGLARLGDYFRTVHRLLKPGGVTLNHGITSSDADSREVGMGAGRFIDRYVFPDGELPHVSLAIRELSAAGLELTDVESLRRHYALTLRHWSDGFERHLGELERMAGAQRARIWRIYLAGCAHAFAKGWINVYQLLAIRSEDGSSPLPLTRRYLYEPSQPD